MEPWVVWVAHAAGCLVSVVGGGALTAWTLGRLRSAQSGAAELGGGLPRGAGQVIGWAERFLAYVTVLAGAWAILSVLVALKTLVRYPEVKVEADAARTVVRYPEGRVDPDAASTPTRREVRFAEYYLVGTLVSLAVGVGLPLILTAVVGTPMALSASAG